MFFNSSSRHLVYIYIYKNGDSAICLLFHYDDGDHKLCDLNLILFCCRKTEVE